MQSSYSNSTQLSQFNYPILTDRYRNVSPSSSALSSLRGTRQIIEYAKLKGFLDSPANKNNLSLLEQVTKDVLIRVIGYMDATTRARFFQTTAFFQNLKEESLRGRCDLTSQLTRTCDIQALHILDRLVLQKTGRTITSLKLANIQFTPEKFELIVRLFPYLQEIELRNFALGDAYCKLSGACLEKLKALKYLSTLVLDDRVIPETNLRIISEFTHLKKLSIRGFLATDAGNATDAGIRFLGNLSQLEFLSLELSENGLTYPIMQELKLKNLQVLRIYCKYLQEDVLVDLSLFTNLKELIIDTWKAYPHHITDPVFKEIGKLTKLTSLTITQNFETTDQALEYLSTLPKLEKLDFCLPWKYSKESLENCLKSFPHLTDLHISQSTYRIKPHPKWLFEVVAENCKGLKRLAFSDLTNGINNFLKFAALPESKSKLPELKSIEFENSGKLQSAGIIESFDQFTKLETFVFSEFVFSVNRKITKNDIEQAKANGNESSGSEVEYVKKLPAIEFTESNGNESDSDSEVEYDINVSSSDEEEETSESDNDSATDIDSDDDN